MYEVGVQMVEIYNEQVRDLLASDGSQRKYPFLHVIELSAESLTLGTNNKMLLDFCSGLSFDKYCIICFLLLMATELSDLVISVKRSD